MIVVVITVAVIIIVIIMTHTLICKTLLSFKGSLPNDGGLLNPKPRGYRRNSAPDSSFGHRRGVAWGGLIPQPF